MKKLSFLLVMMLVVLAGCSHTPPPVIDDAAAGRGTPNPSVKEEIKARNLPAEDIVEEVVEDEAPVEEVVEDVPSDDDVADAEDAMEVVFDVDGFNFGYSLDTIEVNAGDTVTINLTSTDGLHDWIVDEFAAATEKVGVDDGVTSVTFVADQAGTYEFYCSVGQHRANGMVGTLVVK